MGRYYSGDIDGKFWFAVQPSDAADQFGCEGQTSDDEENEGYLFYNFEETDIPAVKAQLLALADILTLLTLRNKHDRDWLLTTPLETIGTELDTTRIYEHHIREFADFRLGRQIYDCLLSTGCCYFDAET